MTESKPKPKSDTNQTRAVREIPSEELFQGARTVVITHSGVQYRLLITRNDKLILQK
ncbi:MAG: hemin uptake protein HemP [Pirellulales bacterium]|jgi:hemin uptake protein HemP|nr:hemin uptake protein HemP [Pirellulales bacterium]HCK42366.1 hemin uptake protein HemP [Planctomycetaceae bacterium]|tara:strand:- start:394 stop:564 length:171 start_codon:yes stop_codon:yes gene_type:complete